MIGRDASTEALLQYAGAFTCLNDSKGGRRSELQTIRGLPTSYLRACISVFPAVQSAEYDSQAPRRQVLNGSHLMPLLLKGQYCNHHNSNSYRAHSRRPPKVVEFVTICQSKQTTCYLCQRPNSRTRGAQCYYLVLFKPQSGYCGENQSSGLESLSSWLVISCRRILSFCSRENQPGKPKF